MNASSHKVRKMIVLKVRVVRIRHIKVHVEILHDCTLMFHCTFNVDGLYCILTMYIGEAK